jgi:hypothetical protein
MSLSVPCTCGKTYQVDDSFAGKRVKCKACGSSLVVPQKQPAPVPDDDEFRLAPLDTAPVAAAPTVAAQSAPAGRVAASPAAAMATQKAAVAAVPAASAVPTAKPSPPAAAPAKPAPAAPAPTGGLPFFLAHLNSALGGSQMYRAYVEADAINLVHLGGYTPLIDVELCRKLDPAHWAVKTGETLKTWVLAAGGGAVAAAGVLGLALSRVAFKEPSRALELVSFVLTAVGLLIPIVIIAIGGSIWRITRRVRQLESMTPEQLREEAAKGKAGLQVLAQDISEVQLQPISQESGGLGAKPVARLSFKHVKSGNWKLNLFTQDDAKLAAAAMRRLAGAGKATIDASFG